MKGRESDLPNWLHLPAHRRVKCNQNEVGRYFSAWPPNSLRMADMTLLAKSPPPREPNRS